MADIHFAWFARRQIYVPETRFGGTVGNPILPEYTLHPMRGYGYNLAVFNGRECVGTGCVTHLTGFDSVKVWMAATAYVAPDFL